MKINLRCCRRLKTWIILRDNNEICEILNHIYCRLRNIFFHQSRIIYTQVIWSGYLLTICTLLTFFSFILKQLKPECNYHLHLKIICKLQSSQKVNWNTYKKSIKQTKSPPPCTMLDIDSKKLGTIVHRWQRALCLGFLLILINIGRGEE
jgi:hypothetical protein